MTHEALSAEPRRRRRKEARPGEIIDAGIAAFGERGFAATRLEDVAARAGIAKGTIYRYFDSKEALFEAAVRACLTPTFDNIGGLVDGFPGSTRDLLEAVLGLAYRSLVESNLRGILRVMIAEGSRFPRLTEFYYRESVAKGRALLAAIVMRGIARGEVRPGPLAEMPMLVMSPIIMAAVWRLVFESIEPLDVERFRAAHLDLLDHGLLIDDR